SPTAVVAGAETHEIAGVTFPVQLVDGSRTWALQGAGVMRYRYLIRVYAGALYTPSSSRLAVVNGQNAWRLEIRYLADVEAKRFIEFGDLVLRRMFDDDTLAATQARLDRLNAWYPDTRKGDQASLTFVPGIGTTLVYNGEVRGTIPGDDFGEIYAAIWFGEEPASPSFRRALLEGP
ncbi:MAG: chalcone isomerase family protein, partial [Verrucomicrobia bacterium]|nr:chalcone isomerase family protein [Verrucomicrobiota bacterium]